MGKKIYDLKSLSKRIKNLKDQSKTIVHCHGCFDLMHPGHIKYFQAAKKKGDILIVTISPVKYVDKGPDRPVFSQQLRAESIAALECVDYVSINKWPTAENTLRLLKPDIYVKGQEFEKLEDETGKLQKEYKIIKEIGGSIKFTHEIVFSSTKLINKYFHNSSATKTRNHKRMVMNYKPLSKREEVVAEKVVDAAFIVHKSLGPGLLERVYEVCFCHELSKRKLKYQRQVDIPIVYDGQVFDEGLRLDVFVEDLIICELKAIDEMNPVWEAQILSHLKLTDRRLGFLINFNVPLIKNGIKRIIL